MNRASKYAEAEPLYRQALAIWRKVLGEDDRRTAGGYSNVALNLNAQGKYAEAQPLLEKALAITRKVLGEDHPDTGRSYNNLAFNLSVQGKYAEAQPPFEKALKVTRKVLGKEHPNTARSYNNVALNLNAQGKYTEAQPLLEKALAITRKVLGEDHPDTAATYNNMALNLNAQGKYGEAQPLYQKALAIKRRVLGEEHPDTALSYINVASNLDAQGKHAEAQPLLEKALAIYRKVLNEEHPHTAQSYNSVGFNLYVQGKYGEAEPLYQKALTIRRKVLGEQHLDTAISYNNLALNLNAQGKYAEAQPLLKKALVINRKLVGEDHAHTAVSYSNLALNLNAQGKYAEAQPLLEKALSIRFKVLGEEHPDTAAGYNNVAFNLDHQGSYAEAQPLYQKALVICQKQLGEDHAHTAGSYNNLALNLNAQGKYAEAQPLLEKALVINRKVLGEEHPETARSYNNLAANLNDQGKYADAQPPLQKSLTIWRKVLGEEHPDTATSYNNWAFNLNAQGKYAEAEASWTQTAQSFDVARLRTSTTGLERAAEGGVRSPWVALATCQARLGQPLLAWKSLEAGLARGLLDDLSARLAPDLTPAERQRQQALNATLDRLDRQVTAVLQIQPQTEKERARFRDLSQERLAAQAELARLAAAVGARQVYDLQRLQEQVAPDAAWIAWLDRKGEPKAVDPSGEHWACILRHQGDPVWVRLPGNGPKRTWTEEDDDLLDRFRLAMSAPPGRFREDLEALTQQVAAQRLMLLEPALRATGSLPAVRHLLVCPVWRMAGVPVEALTDQYTISYVPSGTLLARLQEQRGPKGPAREGATLFALGDPVFRKRPTEKEQPLPDSGVLITSVVAGGNAERGGIQPDDVLLAYADKKLSGPPDLKPAPEGAGEVSVQVWRQGQTLQRKLRPGKLGVMIAKQPASVVLRLQREARSALRASEGPYYPRLPGTRREVQAIAGLFDQPLVLVDAEASAQRLDVLAQKQELRRFRYLHFATHGELNHRIALQSALILASGPQPAGPTRNSVNLPESDGRLTAAQMLQWKLDAELVTLSACQSGLGRQAGGEGYLGFAQALFLAGARSVVLSLWKVDDTATALLMTRFYQNLLGKRDGLKQPLPKAEALGEAKAWLRNLTVTEVERLQDHLRTGRLGAGQTSRPTVDVDAERPYAHPHFWAAFILIGDPN